MTKSQIYKRWRSKNILQERERWQVWYAANREKSLASSREYYAFNKDKKRNRDLKRKFGISQLDYLEMVKKQQGKCAICSRNRQTLKRDLAVDHDHLTGNVRQLLCGRCNLGLAFLENREWNKLANSYLEVHSNHA